MDEFTTDGSGIDEEFHTPTKPTNAMPPDEQGATTLLPTKQDDPSTPKGVSFADSVAGGMNTNEHCTNYATKSTKLDREMNTVYFIVLDPPYGCWTPLYIFLEVEPNTQ